MSDAAHTYLLALGSNVRVAGVGPPRVVIGEAVEQLSEAGLFVHEVSQIVETDPIGPSQRRYANAAALVEASLEPTGLLSLCRKIETEFQRKRSGQRWRARTLDIDIILWSGGIWADAQLQIPHPRFRERDFVLAPATAIAPSWREPITGLSIAQLHARLTRPKRAPR